uniref:Degenerin-like protein unc-105 n=1 Tax=Globodera pallida TaxID=36090 RepID=A0A183CJD3_GLOPA
MMKDGRTETALVGLEEEEEDDDANGHMEEEDENSRMIPKAANGSRSQQQPHQQAALSSSSLTNPTHPQHEGTPPPTRRRPAERQISENSSGAGSVKRKISTNPYPKFSTSSTPNAAPKASTQYSANVPSRPRPKRTTSENSAGAGSAAGDGRKESKQSVDSRGTTVTVRNEANRPKRTPAELRRTVLLANAEHSHPKGGPHAMNAFRRLSRADFPFKRASDRMHMDSVKKIMEKFERHSTIHGICHASLAPNKRWRRFWLAVFAVCFLILVIQVVYLIIKFFGYPKTVDLDLKFENAPFPSVTVCNLNPYKASVIDRDESVQATMNAFQNILEETGRSEGVAAAIASSAAVRRKRRQLQKKARETKNFERRYLQVYAQCYCELSRLSAERRRGSCFAAYKGNVSLSFGVDSQLHNYHPTKCLCQLDWITRTLWPCFPYNTWKEHICIECVDQLGHCPMRFPAYTIAPAGPNGDQINSTTNNNNKVRRNNGRRRKNDPKNVEQPSQQQQQQQRVNMVQSLEDGMDLCVCHQDYNHCVQNNINGEIPEVLPNADLNTLNFMQIFVDSPLGQRGENRMKTMTTQAPEIVQAMGFEELKDEIAIKSRARENLMFAVEEKPKEERIKMSQQKDELILKCSFNQYDCDIKKDFKLFYDPTFGNCYTFNWNRDAHVTAHRAGANYGLRVMLYANVSEYLPTSEAVGFRITVHDKWIVPFADAFGYNAPTGFIEGGEKSETYIYKGYSYSIEGCHRSCTQNEVIRICGCADPLYPVPDNAYSCKVSDPVARDCIKNTSRMLGDLIATGALKNCKCHQPCRETAYEVTYSAARWPSGTTKLMECESSDNLCMEKYRTNAAMVQVFYEELNYETLSESVAYSLTSLFADLGGLTGLWIGISLVSILEVFQLIWFCLDFYRNKKKQQQQGATAIPKKQSTTSSASSLHRTSMRSRKSTKSSMKVASVQGDIVPPVSVVIQEETDEEQQSAKSSSSDSSQSPKRSKGSTGRYLAPGEDLPCTCLYGQRGQIVFMKPLCPFHGWGSIL